MKTAIYYFSLLWQESKAKERPGKIPAILSLIAQVASTLFVFSASFRDEAAMCK